MFTKACRLAVLFLFTMGFVAVTVQAQPEPEAEGQHIQSGVVVDGPAPEPTPHVNQPVPRYVVDGIASDVPPTAVSVPAPVPDAAPGDIKNGVGTAPAISEVSQLQSMMDKLCLPHSPIVIDFDDETQPSTFGSTTALRYDYRQQGAVFTGDSPANGGAILSSTGFGVSGFSAPNFLAFNSNSTMGDGGKPRFPQRIDFLGGAAFVTVKAGSNTSSGESLTMRAYDKDGLLIASDSITLTPTLQPVTVNADHIVYVEISSSGAVAVLDDLTFIPEAIPALVDFDERARPRAFSIATALRDDYAAQGVLFAGPAANDGGAVLDQSGSFGVDGYSPPNFLGFNKGATLNGGGEPTPPQTIEFVLPVTAVQIYAAAGFGQSGTFTMEAFSRSGTSVGTISVPVSSDAQPLTLAGDRITRVVIDSDVDNFVLDDLMFVRKDAAYIDFDDVSAPNSFAAAVAVRDEYHACGARFNPTVALDGGAIIDQSGSFGVSGFSSRNFLALNRNASLSDGGISAPPQEIRFTRPAEFVQFSVGAATSAGVTVTVRAYAANNAVLETVNVTLAANMQPISISQESIERVVVTSNADVMVIDDLMFVLEPIYFLFLPTIQYGD